MEDFPLLPLGTLPLEYPPSYPPPCQSPRKSASIETIVSAFEKS